jgi:hypothetical protein
MAYFSMYGHSNGQREKWTVKVAATKLVTCCTERMQYHRERVDFWTKERVTAEESIRKDGITLTHSAVTGGHRTGVKLDDSMAERISECQQKMDSHKDSFNRFRAYSSMLVLAGEEMMVMHADDVLYFNLENADPEGEEQEPVEPSGDDLTITASRPETR